MTHVLTFSYYFIYLILKLFSWYLIHCTVKHLSIFHNFSNHVLLNSPLGHLRDFSFPSMYWRLKGAKPLLSKLKPRNSFPCNDIIDSVNIFPAVLQNHLFQISIFIPGYNLITHFYSCKIILYLLFHLFSPWHVFKHCFWEMQYIIFYFLFLFFYFVDFLLQILFVYLYYYE